MSFFTDHLLRIIDAYEGLPPLPVFLRSYFKAYPKLGSRDRKSLSEAAFIYYRCKSFYPADKSMMDVVASGYLLCKSNNVFLAKMLGEHLTAKQAHFAEPVVGSASAVALSPEIAKEEWLRSMWKQPQLFIRIRKDKDGMLALLQEQGIAYEVVAIEGNKEQDCIMIPNGTAIDKVLPEDAYVVQDWASQASMYQLMSHVEKEAQVWDVCSGAGGKSILLKDKLPAFHLLASDIRDTILHNLRARFKVYGLFKTKTLVVDSADHLALQEKIGEYKFDLVLCDVPCSGSGTWARTPEQFHFFKEKDLDKFEEIQYQIASNAGKFVLPGGLLAYVTCSVFKQENEDVVSKLIQKDGLELIHQQIINGIAQQADCMFVSFFRKALPDS